LTTTSAVYATFDTGIICRRLTSGKCGSSPEPRGAPHILLLRDPKPKCYNFSSTFWLRAQRGKRPDVASAEAGRAVFLRRIKCLCLRSSASAEFRIISVGMITENTVYFYLFMIIRRWQRIIFYVSENPSGRLKNLSATGLYTKYYAYNIPILVGYAKYFV
jgi:hypothetical protein